MKKALMTSSVICTALALAACGGDSNNNSTSAEKNPETGNGIATATKLIIDASAGGSGAAKTDPANKYTYFSFSTGAKVELADNEAAGSNAWDIAFKRNKIIVNEKTATSALVAKQADFYDAAGKAIKDVFIDATPSAEAQHFIDFTAAKISAAEFTADVSTPALGKDWYSYNIENHKISANTDNFYLIQNAEKNNVSIFNVKDIIQNGRAAASYKVQFFNNSAAKGADYSYPAVDAGTEFIADFSSKTEVCYDLDTHAELDCASNQDTWDLRFDSSFKIWLNGGIHGSGSAATSQPDTFAKLSAMKTVSRHALSADSKSGTFTNSATTWSSYGLNGQHKLWPNYRVYAVKVGEEHYKMRVLSYYAPADSIDPAPATSGVVTFEYEKL